MTTSGFAEKFMATIKAPDDVESEYIKNLALLVSIKSNQLTQRLLFIIIVVLFSSHFRGSFVVSRPMHRMTPTKSSVNG